MRPNPKHFWGYPYDPLAMHHFYRLYRRPLFTRPLFWFAFGAIASGMWIHHHHHHLQDDYAEHRRRWGCQSQRRALEGAANAGWRGDPVEEGEAARQEKMREWGWGWRSGWPERTAGYGEGRASPRVDATADMRAPPAPAPAPATTVVAAPTVPTAPPAPAAPAPPTNPGSYWDPAARDMREFGRQAADAVTEMSEATVDSMIASLQSLKTRIAEKKARQENQKAEAAPPPPPPVPEPPRHLV